MGNPIWNRIARLGIVIVFVCTGAGCATGTARDQHEAAGTRVRRTGFALRSCNRATCRGSGGRSRRRHLPSAVALATLALHPVHMLANG